VAGEIDCSELLDRARAGDPDALLALFAREEPRILRMIELRLEPRLRRRIDSADVVQETWIDATARFDSWRVQSAFPFHVWLRLVAAEALARVHRQHLGTHKRDALREARAESRPSISAAAFAEAFVTNQTSPTQAVRRDEVRTRVLEALGELDELDREIVALRHFEGLSNEDAAQELAIEPAAASKRFVRALLRLRPALKALGPGADRAS
jgi:RNA polymerase sigma-70 factor (ECF subfamily)